MCVKAMKCILKLRSMAKYVTEWVNSCTKTELVPHKGVSFVDRREEELF